MEQEKTGSVKTGEILRKLRGIRTRTGVSRELGIPYSTLNAYERGDRNPSPEIRKKISEYYGVPEENIFFHQ